MRAILPALLAAGCGEVHFVEPNPPRLFRNTAAFTSAAVSEPVVWVAVTNLFIENASECAWARQISVAAIREAIARAGGEQIEVNAQDLSPDCRRRGETPLDVNSLRAGFGAAQIALPATHVRPLIVYVDNIDFPLIDEPAAIEQARATSSPFRGLLWTVSFASVSAQLHADRSVAWSYAGDATLADRIGEVVKAELPLQSTASAASGAVPLLDGSQLDVTREFKVCAVPAEAAPDSYPALGTTHVLDGAHPPTITFKLPQVVATPKSSFSKSTFKASVEGCTANCDRYFIREPGADPFRWSDMPDCALGDQ